MLSDDAIRSFFATVDRRDPDAVAKWFTDDIRLRIGSGSAIEGRVAAHAAFSATATLYAGVRHDITGLWRGEADGLPVASVEATVTYTLQDGEQIVVPCTSTLRLAGEKIADYRIYIDLAPVPAARRARNEDTVRRFLERLEALDFDGWATLFAEHAVQENPYAPAGFPAEFRGRENIRAHYATFPDIYEGMRFPNLRLHASLDPDEVVAEFDGDICLKNGRGKYDNRYCCLFRFDGAGRITLYREYFDPTVLTGAFEGEGPRMHGLPPRDEPRAGA